MFDFEDLAMLLDSGAQEKSYMVHNLLLNYQYQRETVTILRGRYNRRKKHFDTAEEIHGRFFHSSSSIGTSPSLTLYWVQSANEVTGIFLTEKELVKISKKPFPYRDKLAFWIQGKDTDYLILREKVSMIKKQSYWEAGKELLGILLGTEEKRSPCAAIYYDLRRHQLNIGRAAVEAESQEGAMLWNDAALGLDTAYYKGTLLITWVNEQNEQVSGIFLNDKEIRLLKRQQTEGNVYQIFTYSVTYCLCKMGKQK
ncbi:hypothetical protein [Mesobacillus foraminis]|uniref:hypothetical protein n=1 Tax=Mesobacillus foraminis TaxID=279826 RepID=UPI001045F40A|nr:hypothetical protein [Mesobacillus foraminis]